MMLAGSDRPEATVATFSAKAKGLLDFAAHHQHLHAWQNFRVRDNDKRIASFQLGVASDPLVAEGSQFCFFNRSFDQDWLYAPEQTHSAVSPVSYTHLTLPTILLV